MRTPHGRFPEYHTSGDNLDFVKAESLEDSLEKCLAILDVIDREETYVNLNPKGEPQLGRRGIFRALQDRTDDGADEMALLWVLNFSDGEHSLLDIAERADLPFAQICAAAGVLRDHGLLKSTRQADRNERA
jgi:aminopeptidase-like protein